MTGSSVRPMKDVSVSIPRTVVGGLQFRHRRRHKLPERGFNTEDGRGRAAISSVSAPASVSAFNTEDGRGRAAIIKLFMCKH